MFSSTIEIKGPKSLLEAYRAALAPEQNFRDDRASYSLQLKETLRIKITANDATAFRATVTSLAGMLTIVETSWKMCGKK